MARLICEKLVIMKKLAYYPLVLSGASSDVDVAWENQDRSKSKNLNLWILSTCETLEMTSVTGAR